MSNVPSMIAFSSPVRTIDACDLSPQTMRSAFIKTDLPAPVSPVIAVKPSWNGTLASAMSVKLFIVSCFNIRPLTKFYFSNSIILL